MSKSKRPIDKLTTAEISKMYENRKFICDFCGNEIGKCNFTLQQHILHLINPLITWSCEDCFHDNLKNGRIIAEGKEKVADVWKELNR